MSSRNTMGKGRYGSFELKELVGPNLIRGFMVAVLLHGVVAASPVFFELLKGDRSDAEKVSERIIIIKPTVLRPHDPDLQKQVTLSLPQPSKPVVTIPFPTDSIEQEDTVMMVSTGDLRKFFSPALGKDSDGGKGGIFPESLLVTLEEDSIPDITDFIAVEIPPQALDGNPSPLYPELALVSKTPGIVYVKTFVDKSGNVKRWKIEICNPAGLGFDEEVEKVIPQWKFTPAIQGGNAIGVWVTVPFKFKVK